MLKLRTIITTLAITSSLAASGQEAAAEKSWTIKGENTFLINQSSFFNWAAGGINSFAGNLVLNYDFNYAKDKWNWDNKVIAAYGKTFQEAVKWRKNDDRLVLNSLLGYKAADKWLYTFFTNFNTQFTDGFKYDADNNEVRISGAFAPAYLSFGPGIAFKESDNFRINVSPAAARFVIVGVEDLRTNFGVDADKSLRSEFGASLDGYYKVNIMENVSFENILKLYANYLEDPQNVDIDYTANLFMKVNEFITVNGGVQLVYDDNVQLQKSNGRVGPGIQVRQIFGAGVTYKF